VVAGCWAASGPPEAGGWVVAGSAFAMSRGVRTGTAASWSAEWMVGDLLAGLMGCVGAGGTGPSLIDCGEVVSAACPGDGGATAKLAAGC